MGNKAILDYNSLFPAEAFQFSYADETGGSLGDRSLSHQMVWPKKSSMPGQQEITGMIAYARQNERKLIGQELHDNVNQLLSTVKLFMEMLQPASDRDKTIQQKSIDYVMMAISELRKISREMVIEGSVEMDLGDSIRSIIRDIHFSTSIKIRFNYNKNIELLNTDKKINLLRIVQEQLKNIVSYSKASEVTISLVLQQVEVVLSVSDNGIGFDPKEVNAGIGLLNIYDRARACNGRAELQTARNSGCSWEITIPVA